MRSPAPLERDEQVAFVQWLELQGLKFTAIPNSTYTTSWKQKTHNRVTGLRAGFPDLVVLVPPARSIDGLGHLLAPEMKRVKDYTVSAEQKAWIAALNALESPNIESVVAHGAAEAIQYVSGYLKDVRGVEF